MHLVSTEGNLTTRPCYYKNVDVDTTDRDAGRVNNLALWHSGNVKQDWTRVGATQWTVVLVGILVNDANIKTDFINQWRAGGIPIRAAIMAVGHDRVQPILMRTITTVLGLYPLAMGSGQGAD